MFNVDTTLQRKQGSDIKNLILSLREKLTNLLDIIQL
jgi:hypothetical protein